MMNNKDLIQRFLFETRSTRGEWVRLTHTYQTIVDQHHYPPVIKKLIGEMLVVTSLISAILKFKGRVSVQFQGKEQLKLLFAESDHEFGVRAFAQFSETIDEQDLLNAFKEGMMVITMDPIEGKRYQGVVNWQGNSIAESIEGYFRDSEQLQTRLWVAVNHDEAAGLLLQVLPAENKNPDEMNEGFSHLAILTDTITETELLTLDIQTLLHRLYSEEDVRLFEGQSVVFRCRCSRERSENALVLLGRKEAELELKNNKQVVVTCEFCGKEYLFEADDIARIFTIH